MKKYSGLLLFSLIVASCSTQRSTTTTAPVIVQAPVKDTVTTIIADEKLKEKSIFNLQLLLSLNAAHYLDTDSIGNLINTELDPLHLSSLHLYEGLLLASRKGDSTIHISVTDAGTDSIRFLKLLNDKMSKEKDLVISLLNPSMNAVAAVTSTDKNYPLIINQHNTSSLLFGNKNAWLATPSNKTQCRQMASYIQLRQPSAEYHFIYRDGNKKEKDLADLFYSEILALGIDSARCIKINYSNDGWGTIRKNWKTGKRNVVFLPIADESLLASFLAKLNTLEQSEILLVGLPNWEFFETIDFNLLETLNTHIFSGTFIDYDDVHVKAFRKNFIETYHADPLISAFVGYDFYNWVSANFSKHGNRIAEYESIPNLTSPTSGFRFKRICDNCGFENQFISVLKFQEGKLVKVNK
jgi:hypothetical protein